MSLEVMQVLDSETPVRDPGTRGRLECPLSEVEETSGWALIMGCFVLFVTPEPT
jgi:hypothetical protein